MFAGGTTEIEGEECETSTQIEMMIETSGIRVRDLGQIWDKDIWNSPHWLPSIKSKCTTERMETIEF